MTHPPALVDCPPAHSDTSWSNTWPSHSTTWQTASTTWNHLLKHDITCCYIIPYFRRAQPPVTYTETSSVNAPIVGLPITMYVWLLTPYSARSPTRCANHSHISTLDNHPFQNILRCCTAPFSLQLFCSPKTNKCHHNKRCWNGNQINVSLSNFWLIYCTNGIQNTNIIYYL